MKQSNKLLCIDLEALQYVLALLLHQALRAFRNNVFLSEWPWHMWTMGNNGRYITILAIPSYLLIRRVNGELNWTERKAIMGVLVILPISLAAGLHGQTYWTDDAAELMSENMDDGEDFLFVHDSTLAMHYLYPFLMEVNLFF